MSGNEIFHYKSKGGAMMRDTAKNLILIAVMLYIVACFFNKSTYVDHVRIKIDTFELECSIKLRENFNDN